jgi:hypothetical protein
MIFEIVSSMAMAGLAGYTYLNQSGGTSEPAKIQRIAANCGLVVKENKLTQTIHLLRKSKHPWGTEYAYRIPLGLSFSDFEKKLDHLQDGLNNKRNALDITLDDIKKLKFDQTIVQQVRDLLNQKTQIKKEIELEYDGVLIIRVYKEPLTNKYILDAAKLSKYKGWVIPVGLSRKGEMKHNFEERPHMIVAGATGFGKSELIKLIIMVLTINQPKHVKFHLIDLKGGLELGRFKNMEQVVTFERDPKGAKETLKNVQIDMNQKLDDLFEKDFKDIKEAGQKERHFVVIDEAADIADDKECMEIVTDIARRGRAAGYRLIYATQYPTNETLPSQVRANIGARVCYRLETNIQSRAVLDEGGAEELPEIEGRAIFRRVKNTLVQTPYIENKTIESLIQPHMRGEIRARRERRADSLKFEET